MSNKTKNDVIAYVRKICGTTIEIVDADFPLYLIPKACDIRGADPKNPFNCMWVKCAKRMYRSRAAVFWKTTCYVDIVCQDGVRRVLRFMVTATALEQLAAFDRGKRIDYGKGVVLLPPTTTKRLDVKNAADKAYRGTPRGEAVAKLNKAKKRLRALTKKGVGGKRIQEAEHEVKIAEYGARGRNKTNRRRARVRIWDPTTRNGAAGRYKLAA